MMLEKLFISATLRNVPKIVLEFIPQFIDLIDEFFVLADCTYLLSASYFLHTTF